MNLTNMNDGAYYEKGFIVDVWLGRKYPSSSLYENKYYKKFSQQWNALLLGIQGSVLDIIKN